jgi:hypothetical protein
MSERRLLAVLALLLALVGGLLLIFDNLHLPRELTLNWMASVAITIILGVVLIVAGLIAYERRYMEGGVLAIVVGVIVVILTWELVPGILAFASGVMALAAERP